MFDIDRINDITVGILGDPAVDIYWYADMKKSELSRETPHYPLPVVSEKMSLGAGGNVAANIAALKPKQLLFCGVCGDDWRGDILKRLLTDIHVDVNGLIVESGRFTQAYCKPMRMGISDVVYEDPRIDFATAESITAETENKVLNWLNEIDGNIDILCVCDQFRYGVVTDNVLDRLTKMKTRIVADSRYRIGKYRINGILKPNEVECRNALIDAGITVDPDPHKHADALSRITGADILLTLGDKGSIFVSTANGTYHETPAVLSDSPIDTCGAGDTSLSAFACCMAAGASPADAAMIASYASAVTVRKIGTTGTASREEIIRFFNIGGK